MHYFMCRTRAVAGQGKENIMRNSSFPKSNEGQNMLDRLVEINPEWQSSWEETTLDSQKY